MQKLEINENMIVEIQNYIRELITKLFRAKERISTFHNRSIQIIETEA